MKAFGIGAFAAVAMASATVAAADYCVIDSLAVADGTIMVQLGVVDMSGAPVYRQCVHGHLGSPFSASSLPRIGPSPSAAQNPPQATSQVAAPPSSAGAEAAPAAVPPAVAAVTAGMGANPGSGDVESAVRQLLGERPGLLLEALQRAQEDQRRAGEAARASKVAELLPAVIESGTAVGAAEPDLTIVEWIDYACPYCQQSEPALRQLLEADPRIRVVYKELPILGAGSVLAARAALAAREQGAYADFHRALMELKLGHGAPVTAEALDEVAGKLGLDVERMKRDMASPAVERALAASQSEANALGIRSTPTFAFGNEVVPSALTLEGLTQRVASARAKL